MDPTTDELNDVTFSSGINADGTVAAQSANNWVDGTSPAQYTATNGSVHKWDNDGGGNGLSLTTTAGTAGGTVTYSFGSGVTAQQEQAFTATLTLWSDEANIKFVQTSNPTTSDVLFTTVSGQGTYNQSTAQVASTVGSNQIPAELTPNEPNGGQDVINFDTSGGYGTIGSFSSDAGYGVSALTHEVGHMLGLGHSGPYNDGSANNNPPAQQYNEYDSRQWSVMSYIDPSDPTARYYNEYPVKGTNWQVSTTSGNTTTTYLAAPETPMIDDILAVQRLYGASTSTALAGGQTFGFNCNVADASKPFFDFTQNTQPVITLYDTGTNNTLDLSGYAMSCTVNLNPGTFSSVGGLTNNVGIAFGTRIDKAVGSAAGDVFYVNGDSDTIVGSSHGGNTAVFSGASYGYSIQNIGATTIVTNQASGVADTLTNIGKLQFSDTSVVVCFAAGTAIRTVAGDCAVETLRAGDIAVTASGERKAIRWIGRRTIKEPAAAQCPIRISAGAFGADLPARDLRLSPGHPVLVGSGANERLVPIMCLINGTTIARVQVPCVTYWHVELESHDILLAEGLPAESYIDLGSRPWFDGADGALVSPDLVFPHEAGRCRPVAVNGPIVDAERKRLDQVFASRLQRSCHWPTPDATSFA